MKVLLPVTWQVCGNVILEVDEDTMEKAVSRVMKTFDEIAYSIPLPTDAEYVDSSFEMSYEDEAILLELQDEQKNQRMHSDFHI